MLPSWAPRKEGTKPGVGETSPGASPSRALTTKKFRRGIGCYWIAANSFIGAACFFIRRKENEIHPCVFTYKLTSGSGE